MSTRSTLRVWALSGAVAAMLAAAPMTFAQTTPDTPSTPTTNPTDTTPTPSTPMAPGMSDSTAPMASGSSMSSDSSATNLPTDYKILNNRYFDGTDISQAKARGYSDTEVASMVRISKLTGLSFDRVAAMVETGATFPQIATNYNLKLSDVYDVDKEKKEVSDYEALSKYAMSLGKDSSGGMMPMSGSAPEPPMAPTSPSAPMSASTSSAGATLDIVDTAMAAKNLTTLVKALQVAGLVETLKGAGPFTVFAPDNKAFAKLPAGALDALLADPAKLKQVLTYHVIPANITAADAMAVASSGSPTSPPTVEGATLQVTKGKKGKLKVNDANIVKANIEASNGTIHIIDTVLMPPADAGMSTTPTDTTTPPAAPMDNTTPGTTPATPPTDTTPPVAPTPGTNPTDTTPGTVPTTPGQ